MSLNIHSRTLYKTMTVIVLLAFRLFTIQAMPSKGIEFFSGSWPEALQMAERHNKPIFVEMYADWCTPCHQMSKLVFKEEEVGGVFNTHFVNYKMNVETREGLTFKHQYEVDAIPMFLFFDPAGHLLHRHIGKQDKVEILGLANKVMEKIQNWEKSAISAAQPVAMAMTKSGRPLPSLAAMQRQYDNGYDNEDFLYDFAYELKKHKLPFSEVVNKYLAKKSTKSQLKTDKNRQFVYDFSDDLHTNAANILVDKKDWFERIYGVEQINNKLKLAIANNVKLAAAHRDEKLFDKAMQLTCQSTLPNKPVFLFHLRSLYYTDTHDLKNYSETIRVYMKDYGSTDPQFLHAKAWDLMRASTKKDDLKLAKEWVERSVQINNQYYNNETLAYILIKLGETIEAKKVAQEAVNIGKSNGDDISRAQSLLEKLDDREQVLQLFKL